MSVLGDVEILEDGLKMNALGLHCLSVLIEKVFNIFHLRWVRSEILSPCKKCVILGDRGDASAWVLVDAFSSESIVDIFCEPGVLEETLRVIGGVLIGKILELIVSKSEVHA